MLNILKYICYTLFINQRVYLTRLDISRFKKGITSMFKIDERLPKESAKDYVVDNLYITLSTSILHRDSSLTLTR